MNLLYGKEWKFIAPLFKSQIKLIALSIFCMGLYSLATAAFAYIAGPALKIVFTTSLRVQQSHHTGGVLFYIASKINLAPIYTLIVSLMVISAVRTLTGIGQSIMTSLAGQKIQRDIRVQLFEKILKIKPIKIELISKADIITRITTDVTIVEMALTFGAGQALRDTIQILVLVIFLIYLNPTGGTIIAFILPLATFGYLYWGGKIRVAYSRAFELRGRVATMVSDLIRGMKIIKIFLAEKKQLQRFKKENNKLVLSMMKAITFSSISGPVVEIMGAVFISVMLVYFYSLLIEETSSSGFTPEQMVSFFTAVLLFIRPIKSFSGFVNMFQRASASVQRIAEVLEMEEEEVRADAKSPSSLEESVRFEDVYFSYNGKEVFSGLNLTIPKGRITAIAGVSGSGKTTLVNLICGFLEPQRGRILWDGLSYEEINLRQLRKRISVVTQETFLIGNTITENILIASGNQSEEWGKRAMRIAGLHSLAPNKDETAIGSIRLGEEGSTISAGEKQRVCIARAVAKQFDLILLDEPTSSIDSKTEQRIMENLFDFLKNEEKTMVIISHRLSTISKADRIIVISEGKVAEEGEVRELCCRSNLLRKIFSMQVY